MSDLDARAIVAELTRKHKLFRIIETRVHERGCHLIFADIDIDPRTISTWITNAGGIVLYVGREWRFDNWIMCAEIR